MTKPAERGNFPHPNRVESWTWRSPLLDLDQTDKIETALEAATEGPRFDLQTLWRRGGYLGSLFAATDRESNAFLDRTIADGLFALPARTLRGRNIERDSFLRLLARYNGCPLESLRRKLQWDQPSFESVMHAFVERDLIFRFAFEPIIDGRSDLYYLRDTGILHRLFPPKCSENGKGREYFAKSWEGLAIQTVMFGPAQNARPSVWRQGDDEIDLVMRWPTGTPCWAIEIGLGEDKRPSRGFWAGVEQLGANWKCIIHTGPCDYVGDCERLTLERFLER